MPMTHDPSPEQELIANEFTSEEDRDLSLLTSEELSLVWQNWLQQAQITNQEDEHVYCHGVFMLVS